MKILDCFAQPVGPEGTVIAAGSYDILQPCCPLDSRQTHKITPTPKSEVVSYAYGPKCALGTLKRQRQTLAIAGRRMKWPSAVSSSSDSTQPIRSAIPAWQLWKSDCPLGHVRPSCAACIYPCSSHAFFW